MKKALLFSAIFISLLSLTAGAPKNVTLEMSFNAGTVYVDGEQAFEGEYKDLKFPYIVSDQPIGIISLGRFKSIEYQEGNPDNFSVTQKSTSFLLPFTRGGYGQIEEQQEPILSRTFLSRTEPSFYYTEKNEPVVRVAFKPNLTLKAKENFNKRGRITISNTGGEIMLE